MSILIAWPALALLPGALFVLLYLVSRRPVAATTAAAWALYAAYEFAMQRRWLCSGECNIRVDLLAIYPALLVLSIVAGFAAWRRRGRGTPPPAESAPWWEGTRGEWFVVGQIALMALVFVGPRRWHGWPATALPLAGVRPFLGAGLALLGGALFLAGVMRLGPNLTPLPRPKAHATFVDSGAYSLVRHPLYSGGLLLALGWALWIGSWLTLAYVGLLLAFLDLKSRREERWLQERFPGYAAYRRRVRRLVPFLY